MVERGFGLFDDAPDVRGGHALDELLGASVSGDPHIDRTHLIADEVMLDQAGTGSCVRHAVARMVQMQARANTDPAYALPSPRYLTAVTMALLGPVWTWDGTTFGAVLEAANYSGICRESDCPWSPEDDGQLYLDQAQIALDHRDVRSHRLASEGYARIADLEAAWIAGAGIGVGTDVDQPFMDWDSDATWTQTGPRLGGHAQAVVARAPGKWLLAGSYGPHWALNGMIWVSDEQIADPKRTRSIWIVDSVPRWR